jgi:hypothetical protein
MARSTKSTQPTITPTDVTRALASAKPKSCGAAFVTLSAAYGDEVAAKFAAEGCYRLPRHSVTAEKGHKPEAKPRGLMTPAERKRAALRVATTKQAARPKALRVSRKAYIASLAAAVEGGKVTPSEALGRMAAFVNRASRRPVASTAA